MNLDNVHIFTDGSLQHKEGAQQAPWAFVIIKEKPDTLFDLIGYTGDIVAHEQSDAYIGIQNMDSSAGEISALVHALIWIIQHRPKHATLHCDNSVVANGIQGSTKFGRDTHAIMLANCFLKIAIK